MATVTNTMNFLEKGIMWETYSELLILQKKFDVK